jgi:hypothetical protein
MKLAEKFLSSCNEGSWSLPFKKAAAKKLEKLMASPVKKKDAAKKLYDLVGNDELFDRFGSLPDDIDVRLEVRRYLKKLINDYIKNPFNYFQHPEDGVLEILAKIRDAK